MDEVFHSATVTHGWFQAATELAGFVEIPSLGHASWNELLKETDEDDEDEIAEHDQMVTTRKSRK